MNAALDRSHWLAGGLRWVGGVCEALAERVDRVAEAPEEAWPDLLPPHERVFELRTRIHTGYY